MRRVTAQLEMGLHELFAVLLPAESLRFHARVLFSARTVLTPAFELRLDQLGLAEEIAWALFTPLLAREIGEAEARSRGEGAAAKLDEIMARSWVILNRAPSVLSTSLLAFHPVRVGDRTLCLHPLTCMFLNADFDGDQAAVFLPLSAAAQREAGERLSVAAHLRRDSALLRWFYPSQDALWGLASHSLTPEGRQEIGECAGVPLEMPAGLLTREALTEAERMIMSESGVEAVCTAAQRLLPVGFARPAPPAPRSAHLSAPGWPARRRRRATIRRSGRHTRQRWRSGWRPVRISAAPISGRSCWR